MHTDRVTVIVDMVLVAVLVIAVLFAGNQVHHGDRTVGDAIRGAPASVSPAP
jgi:hypothetical protein